MKPITTIIQDGLDRKLFTATYTTKYQNTIPQYTTKQIITKYRQLRSDYIQNFINKWNFPPSPTYIPTSHLKNQAYKSNSYRQLFNNQRLLLVIDYPATITKSDNGFPTINKPKLRKEHYSIIQAVINGPNPDFPIKTRTLILMDYNTLEFTTIKQNTNIDQALTDLTSNILTDPIPTYIIDNSYIPEELTELAQLYDIDIPTRNLITYSTHQVPHGNTYTNMYPRQYTTEDQLQELRELIKQYMLYKIITPKRTKELKEQKELQQQYLDNLNQQLTNLK